MTKHNTNAQLERKRKRARFDQTSEPNRNGRKYAIAAVGAVLLVGSLYAAGMFGRGAAAPPSPLARTSGTTATTPASAASASALAPEGDVYRIPASAVSTTATFFTTDAGSTRVPFFAVRDAAGQVHVAYDACQVCFEAKRGYVQRGSAMQCQNCGKTFPVAGITAMGSAGGCHPIGVSTTTSGDSIVIARKDLEAGARWF